MCSSRTKTETLGHQYVVSTASLTVSRNFHLFSIIIDKYDGMNQYGIFVLLPSLLLLLDF